MTSISERPWIGEKWWVSPFNYVPEVTSSFRLPEKVIFHDVTLRDGEQTPGVVFRREEKVSIAKALDEIGIQRLEAGMPVISEEERQTFRDITKLGLQAEVFGFARLLKEDIDAVLTAEAAGVICEGPLGYPKLQQFGWSEERVFQQAVHAVDYAKSHGLKTLFFGVDSTRAEPSFLFKFLSRLEKETKVDGIVIADTYGCATPEAIKYIIGTLKSQVKLPVEIHCHNDFGLAVANSVAAVSAGAEVVHTSVNGIGERCGNASFEEVALTLRLLYGVNLPFRFEKFRELSKLVERYSQLRLPPNKPVVGDRAFTREAGIGVAGWIRYEIGSQAYMPDLVGNKSGVVLGKKSGRHSVEWKLNQMGLTASPEHIEEILSRIKSLSEAKKGEVTDEEFLQIVNSVVGQIRSR